MKPTTPEQYLASLPTSRRSAMLAVHAQFAKMHPDLHQKPIAAQKPVENSEAEIVSSVGQPRRII